MKKVAAFVLATVLLLSTASAVFAQPTGGTTGGTTGGAAGGTTGGTTEGTTGGAAGGTTGMPKTGFGGASEYSK